MKRFSIIAAAALVCTAAIAKAPKPDSVRIAKYRDAKAAAVSFTFDDGSLDHYTLVAPELEKNGLRGTFWIIGNSVGTWAVSAAQVRDLSDRGHEIGNHTWSHADLVKIDAEAVRTEIARTDSLLESITGKRPEAVAFPFNRYDKSVLAEAMKGRVACRTWQTGQGQARNKSTAEGMTRWLDKVVAEGRWGITMTHGITSGYDAWEDETILWHFFAEVASRQDEIWVDTFSKIGAYVAERDSCVLVTSQKGRMLTVTPQCSLDETLYHEPLTLVVTLDGVDHCLSFNPFSGPITINLRKLARE